MSGPVRVQLRRTKGWRMPENTVSVARPGPWGNPYTVDEARRYLADEGDCRDARAVAVEWFRLWITGTGAGGRYYPPTPSRLRDKLADRNLADVLLELANPPAALAPRTGAARVGSDG